MTTRQSISIAGVVLAALVAAIWAYVSRPMETPVPQVESHSGIVAGEPSESRHRYLREQWPIVRQRLARMAEAVDAAGLRFRSNVLNSTVAQLAAGWYDLQSDRPNAALRHFDGLLDRQSSNAPAWAGKASALITLKRFDDAADAYARLVALAPEDIHARYNLGVLLTRLARYGEAAAAFREVLCRDPRHAQSLYNLARLAQRDGRLNEARYAWEDYTRLRQNDADAWFALGVLYLDSRSPFEAARCFAAVVHVNPEDPEGYQNLAVAHSWAGHPEAALDDLEAADALSPCDPAIMQPLADLHRIIAAWSPLDAEAHLAAAAWLEQESAVLDSTPQPQAVAGGLDLETQPE